MKRFITIIFLLFSLCAVAKPYGVKDIENVQITSRYRFTTNPDGILSQNAVARIDSICYDLRHRGIAQVAVVAVESIEGDDVFEFAYELFSLWGVGSKSDSGLGILLVEELREIRFVTGYGIEGTLPDAICKRLQTQYMLPHFRHGDYSEGMVAGVEAIRSTLNGSELDAGGNDDFHSQQEDMEPVYVLLIFGGFMLIYLCFMLWAFRSSRKCPECKTVSLQKDASRVVSRQMGVVVYEDTYICTKCGAVVKRTRRASDNSSSGGHRGGGGTIIGGMGGFGGTFRGGGGGFGGGWGGGRFGGGGAGSRW